MILTPGLHIPLPVYILLDDDGGHLDGPAHITNPGICHSTYTVNI